MKLFCYLFRVQGAGDTGHETTLEDIDDLLSDSDNNDLF